MPVRPLLSLLSPAAERARLSVLIFHRVMPEPDPLFPDEMHVRRFDEVCGWLKAWFNVLPLYEAVKALQDGSLPARACCITFDDGYADNLHNATPILHKHGLSATFFVATHFLDGGRMWNDTVIESIRLCPQPLLDLGGLGQFALDSTASRRSAIGAVIGQLKYLPLDERVSAAEGVARRAEVELPNDLMMSSDEVRQLRRTGMVIGAHTATHPILARLPTEQASAEMQEGRRFLQELLGERIGLFAYPNGKPGADYLPEHVAIARELGFDAAVSTAWGAADTRTDLFQIPRFTPWDKTRSSFGVRLLRNLL
ncbi:MAG: polysaccharide deacetylase family protein [Burkholderiaceae bacterium]|nr:polysaccharide deacetylase family protein [Burkholderiaceae bacterium]